jgi:hypothetical protein
VRTKQERSNLESTNPSGIGEERDQISFLSQPHSSGYFELKFGHDQFITQFFVCFRDRVEEMNAACENRRR